MLAANLGLIAVCILTGYLLRVFKLVPQSSPATLNTLIIWVSFPALVLMLVPKLLATTALSAELALPFAVAWIQFGLAFVFLVIAAKLFGWERKTTGALMLTAGLGNTSFVGFPLVEAFYGQEGLQYALIVDQGSFFVASTLGLLVASVAAGTRTNFAEITRRVLLFPPTLALIAGILLSLAGAHEWQAFNAALEKLSATLVPLALISVGLQLRFDWSVLHARKGTLLVGLGLKLVVIPALIALLIFGVLNHTGLPAKVSVIEACMAPMITGAIVASEFKLDDEIANLMVGIGIPVSLITIFLAYSWMS